MLGGAERVDCNVRLPWPWAMASSKEGGGTSRSRWLREPPLRAECKAFDDLAGRGLGECVLEVLVFDTKSSREFESDEWLYRVSGGRRFPSFRIRPRFSGGIRVTCPVEESVSHPTNY